jgi:hypothetical protein
VFFYFKQVANVETSVPTSGTQSSNSGMIHNEGIDMVTSQTIMLPSTTQSGKDHSISLSINEILITIITLNINLKFLSYCS